MNNEIVHFTHNDLDAMGCTLSLGAAFPNTRNTSFRTNYRNIKNVVMDAEEYIKNNHIEVLFITDVCFAGHKDLLDVLVESCNKVFYIDHHVYPENFFDEYKEQGVVVSWDITKSASKLTYEFLKINNEKLETLINIINVYDLWQNKHSMFAVALALNEYFWIQRDFDGLTDKIIKNGFWFPDNFKEIVTNHNKEATLAIEKFRANRLIYSNGTTSIGFMDSYFNYFLVEEFSKGVKALLIANSYGIIRVRFNQDVDIDSDVKNKIKAEICGTENTGHLNAFTVSVGASGFDSIMSEIKRISNIISTYLKN